MLRTTTNKAKENIRRYIRDRMTQEEADTRVEEYNANALFYRNTQEQPTLGDWLVDYCCEFDIFTEEQRKVLAEWLEETEEEATKYDAKAVSGVYRYLIAREFVKVFGYVGQCRRSRYDGMVITYRKTNQRAVCKGREKNEIQQAD